MNSFNPKQFKNKKTIYVALKNECGIKSIWDWNKFKKAYIKRQSGNKYYAYKKVDGKQYTKCFKSLDEARYWRATLSGDIIKLKVSFSFEELVNLYLVHYKTKVSRQSFIAFTCRLHHLKPFLKMPVETVKPQTIDSWLRDLKKPEYLKLQHSTRMTYKKEVQMLSQILNYYKEYHDEDFTSPLKRRHKDDCIINKDTYLKRKSENRSKYIPPQDLLKFINGMKEHYNGTYFLIAKLQAWCGLRVGEACSLRFEDLDFHNQTISINKAIVWDRVKGSKPRLQNCTKTREDRIAGLPTELIKDIKDFQISSNKFNGFMFLQRNGDFISYRAIQHRYNKVFEKLQLPYKATHILRHSFASMYIDKTKDIYSLKEYLGHKSISQTEHYAKISNEYLKKSMATFEESLESEVLNFNELKRVKNS